MLSRTRHWSLPLAWFLPAAAAILLAGCESSNIVQVSPDVYQITIKDRTKIGEMDPANYTHRAIAQAMDFAESKGKIALTVSLDQKAAGVFDDFVQVDYQFRLVDKDDPRAKHSAMVPAEPNSDDKAVPVKQPEAAKPPEPIKQPEAVTKPDTRSKQALYDDLMRLDDLRKKGIITQAEFESEKQKLLAK